MIKPIKTPEVKKSWQLLGYNDHYLQNSCAIDCSIRMDDCYY